MTKLGSFFNPSSVAVIGASRSPAKPGHVVVRNFLEGTFRGRVYPVNPKAKEILGLKCFPSVTRVPGKVDLAVIIVPAPMVPKALRECGKKKIPAAIVISGGFRELGNLQLEREVRAIADKHKIRLLGTNCIGVFDPYSGVDTIFNPSYKLERPERGSIAFMTQSGAVGIVILDWMGMKGYEISKFVSYGNATDINESDLLEHLAADKRTKVVCAFIEGVRDGRRFFRLSKEVSRRKPIIVLKGGTTSEGTRAVSSHTGSLAGAAEVYSAAFRQAGIIQAQDIEEIFDFARVLSTQPLPKGGRVQIITDGGGFGVLMADWLVKNGLQLAKPGARTLAKLRKAFPPYFVVGNPVDLTGNATSEEYRTALDAALDDPSTDMVALIVLFQVPALTPEVVEVIAEARKKSKKPIIVIAAGGRYTEVLKKSIESKGVPCFSYPERGARALAKLHEYAEHRRKP